MLEGGASLEEGKLISEPGMELLKRECVITIMA
jgi:hypothetical protein